jgi:hypothetical protein
VKLAILGSFQCDKINLIRLCRAASFLLFADSPVTIGYDIKVSGKVLKLPASCLFKNRAVYFSSSFATVGNKFMSVWGRKRAETYSSMNICEAESSI